METGSQACLLCFKIKSVNTYEQLNPSTKRDIMLTVYPQLNSSLDNLISCSNCEELLRSTFHFKSCCLDVDDHLRNFLDFNNKVDLYKVVLGTNSSYEIKREICRLCLDLIEDDSFMTDNDIFVSVMMETCLPEIDLNLTYKSTFCGMCLGRLQVQFSFVNSLAALDKRLGTYQPDQFNKNNLQNLVKEAGKSLRTLRENRVERKEVVCINHIKEEVVSIKEEVETSAEEKKNEELESPKKGKLRKAGRDEVEDRITKIITTLLSTQESSVTVRENLVKEKSVKEKPVTEKQVIPKVFPCKECEYTSKEKYCLELHKLLTHSDVNSMISTKMLDGVKTFVCNQCTFESSRDYSIWTHILIHKNANTDAGAVFRCRECKFRCQTSFKLTRHMNVHKISERLVCDHCSYTTLNRSTFLTHVSTHMDPFKRSTDKSDLPAFYQCALCYFKTKSHQAPKHFLHHVRKNSKILDCKLCSYQTNCRNRLDRHVLEHEEEEEEPEEVSFFKCVFCEFETSETAEFETHCNQCAGKMTSRESRETIFKPISAPTDDGGDVV